MIRHRLRLLLSLILLVCFTAASFAQEEESQQSEPPKVEAPQPERAGQQRPERAGQQRPGRPGPRMLVAPTEAVKATLPKAWIDQLQWRSIGPANMSGRIPAIAVYEKDSNTWWAASASGGLVKTVNNGITFEHQFDREASVSIGDVQVAQSDPNIVWVGTGEANPRNSVSWGDGVYKSTDGGKTWKNMGLKQAFQIGRIAIHPQDPNIVYVGALGRLWGPNEDRGLYKTTDGGETWNKVLYIDDKTGVIDVQMNPKDPDTLIVATYERERDGFDGNDPAKKFGPGSGVYLTKDGGATFQKVTQGLPNSNLGRIGISIYRRDPKQIYLVLECEKIGLVPENAGYAGLRGEDADVGARIVDVVAKAPAEEAGLKAGDIVIAVDGKTIHSYRELQTALDKRVVGDKVKLGISRDRKGETVEITLGKYPEPKKSRRATQDLSPQEQRRAGSKYAAGLGGQNENLEQGPDGHEYGGIYHSKDGGETWTRINSLNPRPMYYSQIRVDPSDNKFIWVLGTQLYLSKDGGKTFESENTARGIHVDHHSMWVDPENGRHVILGNDGGIHVTYDRGEYWDHLNHVAIGQFYHVAVGPRRNYSVYGGLQDNGSWGGPSRATNGGGPINTDWLSIGGGDGFVCQVDPHDPDQIYSESQGGATGRINLRTGERGFMRPRPPRGTTYRFNWKTPFILSSHNPKIYYSAGNYVFRSPFKGDNLTAISPEITRTDKGSASALAESPAEEGVLYVGTTDGAFWVSKDGGHAWTNIYGKPEKEAPKPTDDGAAKEDESSSGGEAAATTNAAQEEAAATGEQGEEGQGPPGRGPGRFVDMLKQRDANGDGKLTKDELPEQMLRMFDRLDVNGDEVIDEEELQAASERFGRRGRGGPPGSGRGGPPGSGRRGTQERTQESEAAQETEQQQSEEPEAKPTEETSASTEEQKESAEAAKPVIKDDIVSGTWEGQFQSEGMPAERAKFTIVLRMDPQGKLTGSFKSTMSEGNGEGQFDPATKEFTFAVETERAGIDVTGTVAGTEMTGEVNVNSGAFSVPFKAQRTGDAPPAAAAKTAPEKKPGKAFDELLPGPRWFSSIEASRFRRGRVYVTCDGHRSNDDKPYLFVSEDYGQTWRSLLANLPESIGSTRVIREDVKNENVLYLGTEFSIWISIDRGESWAPLNSNLPTVAVHEVAIHPTAGEIVAATHGRSLWILDVAALRQVSAATIAADAYLYAPQPAIKWRSTPNRGSSGTRKFVGENPTNGSAIYYSLGKDAGAVSLKITDIEGKVLTEIEGDAKAGMHRVVWDMRQAPRRQSPAAASPQQRSQRFRRGGATVPAGKYLLTLVADDQELKQVLTIENDPDAPTDASSTEEEWLEEIDE